MKKVFLLLCLVWNFFVAFSQPMPDYLGQVFPKNHVINTRIDSLPVHPNSQNYINSMGANTSLHPDFGTQWEEDGKVYPIGIPYNIVGAQQPVLPVTFVDYDDESDPGPWPIPRNPFIETVKNWKETDDGDRHLLIIDSSRQMLYEAWHVYGNYDGSRWEAGCGAAFNLTSNKMRPDGWTSADAAGLPVFPLLIRYDEAERAVKAGGEITHAIRLTAQKTQKAYIWPARHYASNSTDQNLPPMGLRFRLKANYDISGYTPRMQVLLKTFKKYGLIMSDNGSNWYFQGTHDERWDDEEINTLKKLKGGDFEVVDISPWLQNPEFDPNSGAVSTQKSSIKNLHQNSKNDGDVVLLQNPVQHHATIRYNMSIPGVVKICIIDIRGKTHHLTSKFAAAGMHTELITRERLPPGIFLIKIIIPNCCKKTLRFVVSG